MDGKLNYPRFRLCKKPHEITPVRREITFSESIENGLSHVRGATLTHIRIFRRNLEGFKTRKYKSLDGLISMD